MLTVGDTRSIGEITLSAIYLEGATLTNWISNQCSITLHFNALPICGWENHAELMDYHLNLSMFSTLYVSSYYY